MTAADFVKTLDVDNLPDQIAKMSFAPGSPYADGSLFPEHKQYEMIWYKPLARLLELLRRAKRA